MSFLFLPLESSEELGKNLGTGSSPISSAVRRANHMAFIFPSLSRLFLLPDDPGARKFLSS